MKRILAGLVLGFLVLVFASQYSSAQTCGSGGGFRAEGMPMMSPMRHDGRGMMGREHHLWKSLMNLGLDEKQREAIKEIKSRTMKDAVRKRADLEVARIELRDLLDKDQVDMNATEATLKKIASLQADMRLSHIKAMQEIKNAAQDVRKKILEVRSAESGTGA